MDKSCSICKEMKPLEDFHKDSHAKTGRYAQCKACQNARQKEIARSNKVKAVEYLGGKCKDCGGAFHVACMDFHHINPDEKTKGIAGLGTNSWKNIKIELDKCVLLCANCHRIRHYG